MGSNQSQEEVNTNNNYVSDELCYYFGCIKRNTDLIEAQIEHNVDAGKKFCFVSDATSSSRKRMVENLDFFKKIYPKYDFSITEHDGSYGTKYKKLCVERKSDKP